MANAYQILEKNNKGEPTPKCPVWMFQRHLAVCCCKENAGLLIQQGNSPVHCQSMDRVKIPATELHLF